MNERLVNRVSLAGVGLLLVVSGLFALAAPAAGSTPRTASAPKVRIRSQSMSPSGYADARCKKGEQATGGGAAVTRGLGVRISEPEYHAAGAVPGKPATNWAVNGAAYEPSPPVATTVAYAVCETNASAPKVVVRSASGSMFIGPRGTIADATASCNPGEQAMGGGAFNTGGWIILDSQPETKSGKAPAGAVATKWQVVVGNEHNTTSQSQVTAYVLCESTSAPKVRIRLASRSTKQLGPGQTVSVTASCKPGEQAVGGGGDPLYVWDEMQVSQPESSSGKPTPGAVPTKWKVKFVNYGSTGISVTPSAYVMCEPK